jgi:uncharacterized spore protein YtfJ
VEAEKMSDEIRKIGERASVKAAFGEPETFGERTIIPVAGVMYGYGMGYGEAPATKEGETTGPGSGAGGGGGGWTSPYGVLEITPRGVKFINTVDSNKLGMIGIAMVAWNVFWITYTVRSLANKKWKGIAHFAGRGVEMPVDKKTMMKMARMARKKAAWMPFIGK